MGLIRRLLHFKSLRGDRCPQVVLAGLLLGPLLIAQHAVALSFANVVSIGDSLVNLFGTDRGPIVAEHLADRLGVSNTNFFTANFATTQAVVDSGAHISAAASFGPGDLAVLWFGGNDFLAEGNNIAAGDFTFLAQSESNYSIVLDTLRDAGVDVLVLNLFDVNIAPQGIAQIPDALRSVFRAATQDWNGRLQALAASRGAAYADVFQRFDAINANPADFSILGVDPILAPFSGCDECLFFDQEHISTLGQAYATNASIEVLNGFFDPEGGMPLAELSQPEIAALTNIPEPDTSTLIGLGLVLVCLQSRSRGVCGRRLRPEHRS